MVIGGGLCWSRLLGRCAARRLRVPGGYGDWRTPASLERAQRDFYGVNSSCEW